MDKNLLTYVTFGDICAFKNKIAKSPEKKEKEEESDPRERKRKRETSREKRPRNQQRKETKKLAARKSAAPPY